MDKKTAKIKINKILDNLNDRSGFDSFWCDIDKDIQKEIKDDLINILIED